MMSPSAAECAAVVEVVPVVGVGTLAFVASDDRAPALVAPRGLLADGVKSSTLPAGVVFPADRGVSGATVTAFPAAPRVLFADVVFAAALVVRGAGACFAEPGAVVDLVAAGFGALAFAAVDFAAVVLPVVALVAVDFAAAGLVGAVLLAAVLRPPALVGLALLAADLASAGVAAAFAAFAVGAVLPAGFAATRLASALAGPVAFAVVDAFLPVRPDVAAADTVAVVVRARPAVFVAATEGPA
jgi:hypothetical protein